MAVTYAANALFVNAGQTCIAPTRVFVQSAVHDQFVKKFVETASKIKVGDAFEADVFQGPQVSSTIFCFSFVNFMRMCLSYYFDYLF